MVADQHKTTAIPYEIRIEGHLSETWSDWFEGLTFQHEYDGTTILSGKIIDQAALHGLLKIIRDLGIPLLSVNRIEMETTETRAGADKESRAGKKDLVDEAGDENTTAPPGPNKSLAE